jgi:hypothetical protein
VSLSEHDIFLTNIRSKYALLTFGVPGAIRIDETVADSWPTPPGIPHFANAHPGTQAFLARGGFLCTPALAKFFLFWIPAASSIGVLRFRVLISLGDRYRPGKSSETRTPYDLS